VVSSKLDRLDAIHHHCCWVVTFVVKVMIVVVVVVVVAGGVDSGEWYPSRRYQYWLLYEWIMMMMTTWVQKKQWVCEMLERVMTDDYNETKAPPLL
jgi:hypothetical protein